MINKTGKDLTKEAPRSPKVMVNGFMILGRTIDKCRAMLWGNIGEYHFDCPLDNQLFSFKGLKGDDFKAMKASYRALVKTIKEVTPYGCKDDCLNGGYRKK